MRTTVRNGFSFLQVWLAVLFSLPAALFLTASAQAATIIVNSTADTVANDGVCTLREAIIAANTNTVSGAAAGECAAGQASPTVDTIAFNIPGSGVHTIIPTSALPAITDPVLIDGYTQPGASPNTLAVGNDAVLLIEINRAAFTGDLFQFSGGGSGSTVRGLVISHVPDGSTSFTISASNNNTIAGNFIGTDPTGAVFLGATAVGIIVINGSTGNTIGGTTPADRNVIVGGTGIESVAGFTLIQGNYIGLNAAGTAALQPPSSTTGILMASPIGNNTIGGTTPGAGNVILATGTGILVTALN